MIEQYDYFAAKAALEWLIDLGVDETIGEIALNRYDEPIQKPNFKINAGSNIAPIESIPKILSTKETAPEVAKMLASRCHDLDALRNAMAVFDLCSLKKGARNSVFSQGNPQADVMIIGDAPGRGEDQAGVPFSGREGVMLDKMFAAIGLSRYEKTADKSLYLSTVIPWRPPQSRDPSVNEIAMMLPFLRRHIVLASPKILVLMGNSACAALLGKTGVSRLRGRWIKGDGYDILPMLHPSSLLRDWLKKRDTWADLLNIKTHLKGLKDEK